MKNRFGENLQLFEHIVMFRCFHQLFSEKLLKVLHFVKNLEKSAIWRKLATFEQTIIVHTIRLCMNLLEIWRILPPKLSSSTML